MSKTNEFSGFEVIRTAMEIEKAGHVFYSEMSRLASQIQLRHLFNKLAEDEVQHLQTLQRLIENNFQGGAFWENEQDYLPYLNRFEEFELFPKREKLIATLKSTTADRQILELAIAAEIRFSEYFAVAALYARTEEGKEAFSWLACEERQHAELLTQRLTDIPDE